MSQPLTDAINALTRYANETTGASDPDLSSAVRTLCDGYGGGGGYTIDAIAEKSITGDIVLDTATVIKFGAFAESAITSATGTAPTRIETEAFRYCASLITIEFPNVVNVNVAGYAFATALSLKKCIFRNCQTSPAPLLCVRHVRN